MSHSKVRKPGAGLSQIFPSQEGPTGKMSTIEPTKEKCPKCGGSTLMNFERVGEPDRLPRLDQFGVYRYKKCDFCKDGFVSSLEAETYRDNETK